MASIVSLHDPEIRRLPLADERNRPSPDSAAGQLWSLGRDGFLRFRRCRRCRSFSHPPRVRCGQCGDDRWDASPVQGTGVIDSFTVNFYRWEPELAVPYVIGLVRLDEAISLTTNLVRVEPDEVRIGMPVRALLVDAGGLYIPVFEPRDG